MTTRARNHAHATDATAEQVRQARLRRWQKDTAARVKG